MIPRLLVSLAALAALSFAQPEKWFPRDRLMTTGVYYYPEAWPESQWDRDISNIKKFGFEYIHVGEFAWAFMEPSEGHYIFDWLDRVVALAHKYDLKVVLCTPTATPPAWLTKAHPETLMINADGIRMQHGAREQADWSSPVYRAYVEKIVAKMAEHYGTNPTVWGWQLDNELSHYGQGYSFAPASQTKFRAWVKEKYGTVDKLNADWGNSFWSQMYSSFDQIDMPNQKALVAGANPQALLDLHRWFAAEAADYLRFQTATLRRYVKNQWITTNYMSGYEAVDPALSAKDLDILTFTMYPVSGGLNQGALGFRIGDPAGISFIHDYLRNLGSGIEGPMELQPGQVNWGGVNPWPQPGVIHAWIMRAFAQGARIVCTYRYRQPLAGDELYHKTIVEPDGVTLAPGGKEFVEAMNDVREYRKLYKPGAAEPPDYAARRTAFLIDYESRWNMEDHKQTYRWNSTAHWLKYYRTLKTMLAPVDVITEAKDFSKYRFLVAPAHQLIDRALIDRFQKYAENGGTLILTCRTGQKDRRGHLWESMWAQPIYDLIGAAVPHYDLLPNGRDGKVTSAGKTYAWGTWGDLIEPRAGTDVLATYADQFYKGTAAATRHKLGKGQVIYIGVDTVDGTLEADLLRSIYDQAGVKPAKLPADFLVDWRDGFWVATNFTSEDVVAPSGKTVPPGGTTVWQ